MAHIVFVESNALGLQAFAAAKAEGHTVTFLCCPTNGYFYGWDGRQRSQTGKPPFPEFTFVDRFMTIDDSMNAATIERALIEIQREQPIDAVISVVEYSVLAAAEAAAKLKLLSTNVEAVRIARNKHELRRVLATAGVEEVGSRLLDPEVLATWDRFPAVVKPIAGCASQFVCVVQNREDLQQAIADYEAGLKTVDAALARVIGSGLLIEDYLAGPMLSIEVIVGKSVPRVLTVSKKKRSRINEVIELGTHMPGGLPDTERQAVEAHIIAAVRAIGVDRGCLHIEAIYTKHGPRIIEMNPRLMGGPLPVLYRRVHDADVFKLLIDAHLDLPLPTTLPVPKRYGVSRVFGALNGGRLNPSFDLSWTAAFKPVELELKLGATPGQEAPCLKTNHDYLGRLTVIAPTAAAAGEAADDAVRRLSQTLGVELAD